MDNKSCPSQEEEEEVILDQPSSADVQELALETSVDVAIQVKNNKESDDGGLVVAVFCNLPVDSCQ
eukprot:9544270-Ditylum_brightwellii.AAC.1